MKTVIPKIVLSLAVSIVLSSAIFGQGESPRDDQDPPRRQGNNRPNVLRHLGLSPGQLQQIRQLNMRRRPIMEAAQLRFREANRRLDEAIYADQLNETEVQDRIKEVQESQSELIRMRSMSELTIRKVLTPEQLTRFRRLRQRYEEVNSRSGRQALAMPSETGPFPNRPLRRR